MALMTPLFIIFRLHLVFATEGFFTLDQHNSLHQRMQETVVKIKLPKKGRFTESLDEISPPYLDDDGHVVITWPVLINKENCSNLNFSNLNYFHEACEHLRNGGHLDSPIPINYSGSGYFSHHSGKILTAKHVVDDCGLFFNGSFPFFCPLVEVEIPGTPDNRSVRGANILTWSQTDGPDGALDYALLGINYTPPTTLRLCNQYELLAASSEPHFLFGYPMFTRRQTNGRYQNADGTLRMSIGRPLFLSESTPILSDYIRNPAEIFDDFLFSDVDAVGGNSGGPLVLKNGCVLGTGRKGVSVTDFFAPNHNTAFLASIETPTWISLAYRICDELNAVGLGQYLMGCERTLRFD